MLKKLYALAPFTVLSLILFSLFFLSITPIAIAQDSTDIIIEPATETVDDAFIEAQKPLAPTSVAAIDLDNDGGGAVLITWDLSVDDVEGGKVKEYLIMRSASAEGPFEERGNATLGIGRFTDNQAEVGEPYYYQVVASNFARSNGDYSWKAVGTSQTIGPVSSSAQWFNSDRTWVLVWMLLVCGAIIFYIWKAKSGKKIYIRKIAGIEEVENAVGRATEMGKSIYYVPGINDMDDVQTLASMSILGRVARIAAENNTRIDVPVSRSLVMVTAHEMVKEAYSKAGCPDLFQDDQVRYLTDDQFGYAAAIDGLFVREKPAAIFLIGAFFAESLIMAETGNSIGAIQIAGTAMPAQLPFFVAACDYTLIGEELFAASAYLSREPKLLGSLKGQDFGKALFLLAIIIGMIMTLFGVDWLSKMFIVR